MNVSKLIWVLLPLVLYALHAALSVLRGRTPSRHALNVHTSLLLVFYLLSTAGLGVFWVANQQLPVFDVHYLFGYVTILLVAVHLVFNLPVVLHWLTRTLPKRAAESERQCTACKVLAIVAALGLAFFLGTRHGEGGLALQETPASASHADPLEVVIRYHEFSSESRSGVFRRAPSVAWGASPPPFKRYPGVPAIALPAGPTGERGLSDALRSPASRAQRLRLAELGEMLYLSAGITERRGGNALRASPSSGGLFPGELYVIARDVDGLPSGLYHYDPEHNRLDALGAVSVPEAADGDALVVLTAVFRRTGYKYRDRAYRYAMADAGHLLENLRLAGHQAGMRVTPLPRFDEARIAGAIGVDGIEEGVLSVVHLHRGEKSPAPGANRPHGGFAAATVSPETSIGVTGMVHQASSLQHVADEVPATIVALPAPASAVRSVHDVITHRRSARRFSDSPVPLATLSSLLADLAMPAQLSGAIRINLIVNRVDGLRPGVYRYLPQHALALVREGEFAAAARSAALAQDVIGDAAVVLVLSAERGPMLAEGARGYRHAYLEAGMIGERWLLGAVARDLAACPVGAFYDDEAASLAGIDRRREWVLHFAALGRAQ